MGEAKRRGTYEERKQLAIEKAQIEREEYSKQIHQEKERHRRREAQQWFTHLAAMAGITGELPYFNDGGWK